METNLYSELLVEDAFTKKYGTSIDNIKIIENYFSQEECSKAIDIIKQFEIRDDRKHLYPLSMSNNYVDFKDSIFFYSQEIAKKIIKDVSILWNEPLTQYRQSAYLTVHPEGSELHPHTDILDLEYPDTDPDNNTSFYMLGDEKVEVPNSWEIQSKIFPNMWSGHLACLVYLNDDYEGGEIFFPRYNLTIKPKAGTLITFPGSLYYIHGVKKITNGNRFTITEWASFDFLNGLVVNIDELQKNRLN